MNDATQRSLVHPRRLLIELAESMFGKGRVEDTLLAWRLDKLGRSLRDQFLWERVIVRSPIGI
jgi:DNA invertase Pin-like site-specific DNA recombinase